MIYGPRWRYTFDGRAHPALADLEDVLPGCELAVPAGFGRTTRLRKLGGRPPGPVLLAEVAAHSAWLLEQHLHYRGVAPSERRAVDQAENITAQPSPEWLAWCPEFPEIKADWTRRAGSYQRAAAGWSATRPWLLNCWRTGAGKTLGGLFSSLYYPGPILVVCPGGARGVWASQVPSYTNLEPHVVLPASDRGKTYENLASYLVRVAKDGKRPVVVVGAEDLPTHVEALAQIQPSVLLFDEIHAFGDHKRWILNRDVEGNTEIQRRGTAGAAEKRSLAAYDVSRFRSLRLRVGLTGTPLDGGKPRRLWSPLDLLSPGGFGAWNPFATRYCDMRRADGYMDDSGVSHFDELRARCSFLVYDVPRSVSHAELPDLRVEVTQHPDVLSSGLTEGVRANVQACARALAKARGSSEVARARGQLREAHLAFAACVKRKIVVERASKVVMEGGKVVIFVGRIDIAEDWASKMATACPGAQGWLAHGEIPNLDGVVKAFGHHPGPCWIVGTYQAIGQSKDGMQTADLGVIAQFPLRVSEWTQAVGRFDRKIGEWARGVLSSAPLVWIPCASGTIEDREILRLTEQFGPVEEFLCVPELRDQGDKLQGLDDLDMSELLAGL